MVEAAVKRFQAREGDCELRRPGHDRLRFRWSADAGVAPRIFGRLIPL